MELTIFELALCPYCIQEREIIDELVREHPEFGELSIRRIDEREHPDIADQYDYYYVPSIYAGEEKLYEANAAWDRAEAKRRMEEAIRKALSKG